MRDIIDFETNRLSLLDFDKAVYEYCIAVYKTQLEKRSKLENKAKFLMSFITIFIGAIGVNFIKITRFFDELANNLGSPKAIVAFDVILAITLIFLSIAVFSIFMVVKPISYKEEYPKDLAQNLFDKSSLFFSDGRLLVGDKTETLYKALAFQVATTIDDNAKLNREKARWIRTAWFCLIISIFLVTIFFIYLIFV